MTQRNRGFTVVEVIVIIAVIAILAAISTFGVARFSAQANDSRRFSNTEILSTYLEKYYDQSGEYPSCTALSGSPANVVQNVLVGMSEETMVMPNADSGTSNSIACADITASSDDNILAYVGTNCSPSSCRSWKLKYKEELTGDIVEVSSSRVAVAGATGQWKDIEGSDDYTCGIAENNMIYCWGQAITTPQLLGQGDIPAGATVSDISSGSGHFCAIAAGWGYCWGTNTNGRLGDGTTTARLVPTRMVNGVIPTGVTIAQMSAGGNHTCALGSNGTIYCWGYNANGQLGRGNTTSSNSPVVTVQGAIPSGTTVTKLTAGGSNTCALMSNNWAYCWGAGSSGELGNSSTSQSTSPAAVSIGAIPLTDYLTSMAVGGSHSCALSNSQKVYCWGAGFNGRLGNSGTANSTSPAAVTQGSLLFTTISVGAGSSCARATDQTMYCWGYNALGQLGLGHTAGTVNIPQPLLAGAIPSGVTLPSVRLTTSHSCAVGSNDTGYCWGDNTGGKLGNGNTTAATQPVIVTAPY